MQKRFFKNIFTFLLRYCFNYNKAIFLEFKWDKTLTAPFNHFYYFAAFSLHYRLLVLLLGLNEESDKNKVASVVKKIRKLLIPFKAKCISPPKITLNYNR